MMLNIFEGVGAQLERAEGIDKLDVREHLGEPDVWQSNPEYFHQVFDAIAGKQLDVGLVALAHKAEIDFLLGELKAYKYDQTSACLAQTGRRPIPCKWVDVTKGDDANPTYDRYWSSPGPGFRAPPYEALRFLLSCVMTPRDTSTRATC